MDIVRLSGLLQVEWRGGSTSRWCDGGIVKWGSDYFRSSDDDFGSVGGIEQITEQEGQAVPDLKFSLLVPTSTAVADLVQPGYQGSPVKVWIAEVDDTTGLVDGTPDLMFLGQIDQMEVESGRGLRRVTVTAVPLAERLFNINTGNRLNPMFHKRQWSGELGEDNATGLGVTVAWGVANPNGSAIGTVGGGGGGGAPSSQLYELPGTAFR